MSWLFLSERNASMASAPSRLQRLPSPSIRCLTTEPHADSTTPVPTGKPAARYCCIPAPVVVEEGDDFRERLPHRLSQVLLREDLAQAADDVAHPAAENRRQLLLHPVLARLGLFPAQRVLAALQR